MYCKKILVQFLDKYKTAEDTTYPTIVPYSAKLQNVSRITFENKPSLEIYTKCFVKIANEPVPCRFRIVMDLHGKSYQNITEQTGFASEQPFSSIELLSKGTDKRLCQLFLEDTAKNSTKNKTNGTPKSSSKNTSKNTAVTTDSRETTEYQPPALSFIDFLNEKIHGKTEELIPVINSILDENMKARRENSNEHLIFDGILCKKIQYKSTKKKVSFSVEIAVKYGAASINRCYSIPSGNLQSFYEQNSEKCINDFSFFLEKVISSMMKDIPCGEIVDGEIYDFVKPLIDEAACGWKNVTSQIQSDLANIHIYLKNKDVYLLANTKKDGFQYEFNLNDIESIKRSIASHKYEKPVNLFEFILFCRKFSAFYEKFNASFKKKQSNLFFGKIVFKALVYRAYQIYH